MFSHALVEEFHRRNLQEGEVTVRDCGGRLIRYPNGALMELGPAGEACTEPPSDFQRDMLRALKYAYWKRRMEIVKDKFDELFSLLHEHLKAGIKNPGFPLPDDSKWVELEDVREKVVTLQAEMLKYEPHYGVPAVSSKDMDLSRQHEEQWKRLMSYRI